MEIYKAYVQNGQIGFADELVEWNHGNVVAKVIESRGRREIMPVKDNDEDKIDCFMSNLMIVAGYEHHRDKFVECGFQLLEL